MDLAPLLPLILLGLIFWLLIIRPASRRQKQMAQLQSQVDVGNQIVLTSGIHGTVVELGDATIDVEVATGVVLTVARGAIGTVVPPETDELDELDELEDPADDEVYGDEPADGVDLDEPDDDRTRGDR